MGWLRCDDHGEAYEHEGYVVGVARTGGVWRELGSDFDPPLHPTWQTPVGDDGLLLQFRIQLGCECGWRSRRMVPPLGTEWMRYSVILPAGWEDVAWDLWDKEHRDLIDEQASSLPYKAWMDRQIADMVAAAKSDNPGADQ